MYRYSGQADIRVGVPIANRNRVETERLIGFFVNTQVLKADLDGRMGFDELLAELQAQLVELAQERRRFGYRRLHILLRRAGVQVNHKRIYRLYRAAGLMVKRRRQTVEGS